MSLPEVVARDAWVAARKKLLEREKALTRERDDLNAERRGLPMVRIDKEYVFDGPDGKVTLLDMFDDRHQLILRHVMFDPEWEDGCPSCTAGIDEMCDGLITHLNSRDTSFVVVGRAPSEKIERYKAKRGWSVPFFSSYGSDFNYDFHVTLDASVAPVEYNYRDAQELEARNPGQGVFEGSQEVPGQSCFLRVGDDVFHTYSSYARGAEMTGGSYYFLDLTALGRQEDWEEPKGRADSVRGAVPDFS